MTIYIAGDSTAATYDSSSAPLTGWGQALSLFMLSGTVVDNRALSGRSSKSFYDQGHLAEIVSVMKGGDSLLIAFAHNDENTSDPTRYTVPGSTFEAYLQLYIDAARNVGARPILLTPCERRRFTAIPSPYGSHAGYVQAIRKLAWSQFLPLIDLTTESYALWAKLGSAATQGYFLYVTQGDPTWPYYTAAGIADDTHFQRKGAIELARIVASKGAAWLPVDQTQIANQSIPDTAVTWAAP